ncbi:MAG: hypothetical protein ACUZ8H_12225 [Candidatus Anammoxibacter sp.]
MYNARMNDISKYKAIKEVTEGYLKHYFVKKGLIPIRKLWCKVHHPARAR